jgi:hypothetical protein
MKPSFRILLLIFLTSCFFPACRHNNYLKVIKTDWKKDNLKGRVKKIESVRYFESGPEREIEEFNEQGFLIRRLYGSLKNKKLDPTYYQYDITSNTTIVSWTSINGQRTKSYYEYDDKGNLVEDRSGEVIKKYSYDDSNRVVEEKVFINGSLYDKTVSEYKPDGSMVSITTDGRTGRKTGETTKNDSVEFRKHFDDKGAVENTDLFKFDKAGKLLYGKGEIKDWMFYTNYYYNDHSDVIMEVSFDSRKNATDTIVYTYTYDKTGNWIQKKGKCDRQITYW